MGKAAKLTRQYYYYRTLFVLNFLIDQKLKHRSPHFYIDTISHPSDLPHKFAKF